MSTRLVLLTCLVVGAIVVAGCTKKEQSQTDTGSSPSGAAPQAEGHAQNDQVSTEGSVADILGRVHDQEHELDQIITNGQLSEVHKKAFAIRDLVLAATGKATNLAGAAKNGLDQHVKEVSSLASELDEAGDSGNLAKTKSLYTQLQVELRGIDQILGTSGH